MAAWSTTRWGKLSGWWYLTGSQTLDVAASRFGGFGVNNSLVSDAEFLRLQHFVELLGLTIHRLGREPSRLNHEVLELLALLVLVGERGELVNTAETIAASDLNHGVPLAANLSLSLGH